MGQGGRSAVLDVDVECGYCCNHHIRDKKLNYITGTNKGKQQAAVESCSLGTAVGRNSIPYPHRYVRARARRFQAETQSHHQPFRYTYVFPHLLSTVDANQF